MKANLRRKLVVSIGTAIMTACCLTSTTYAWFAKNANAWTDEFEVKLHTDEGLQISIDGENYYDSINEELLTRAIAYSRYKLINGETATKTINELTDGDIASYSQTELAAVSPDKNMDFWGYSTVDRPVEDTTVFINPVTKEYTPVNLTEEKCGKSYITFDLYFRAIPSSSDAKDKYKLIFATEALADSQGLSYIKAEDSTVNLSNWLMTPDKKYVSSEDITINAANAMRMSATLEDGTTKIWEPNAGYGSYALKNIPDTMDSETKKLYDPDLNPMVTYFNNTHNLGKLSLPDYDESYINTIKDFEGMDSLGTFTRTNGSYNDVKVTFNLWLDGYDADYLEGVDTSTVHFFLNFTKTEEA